ncbi:hypothetical protein [Neobacillus sp.]|uniref:hypothetical protein n=1 Tax=Neobacillus sp. TaxID=2675273 RepID=UPI0028A111C9|nr:hypothetical protein [Neobacillus sp.]
MKNNSIQQMASYMILFLLGTVFFYFNDGLQTSITYGVGFIIFGLAFGFLRKLFSKKDKESVDYPLPETDERIEKLSLKLMAQIFALSHLIGAVILFGLYITDKGSMIRVDYVLAYVVVVLFFTLTFGPKIVKNFDQ